MRIPQELAAVGFDGLPDTVRYWPPLTTAQCRTAMEEFFGIVSCTVTSVMSNGLKPSACEDVAGAIGTYAPALAFRKPSALVDWINSYTDDPDKGVIFHCSSLPADILHEPEMSYQDIIAGTVGTENTFATVVGRVTVGPLGSWTEPFQQEPEQLNRSTCRPLGRPAKG
jgi:L-fucose isomerase-like protein